MSFQSWIEPFVGVMWLSITTVMQSLCDGIILASPEAYEPDGTAQVRKWMQDTGRNTWCLGPSVTIYQGHEGIPDEGNSTNDTAEIQSFMNKISAECGEKSLLYVSFACIRTTPLLTVVHRYLSVVFFGHPRRRRYGHS